MGSNYYTPWVDGTSKFRAAHMNAVPESLDSAVSIAAKRPIVHCNAGISWASGTLTWNGTINIVFNNSSGEATLNTVSAGSLAISDNEFAYVTLNETNNTILTVSKAAVTTGSASNFLSKLILVLAYRNTTSDDLFPVWLPIQPHFILDEGTALPRKPSLNFVGAAVAVTDESTSTKVTIRNGIPDSTVVGYADPISVNLASYNLADITLAGNPTINFTGGVDGQVIVLRLRQDGTGSRTVTWGAMVRFSTDTPEPTLSTAAGALDYLSFRYNEIDVSSGSYDFMAANKGF